MTDGQIIQLKNISQNFEIDSKKQIVLKDISFEIKKGEFVCIVGPSGCGKSTLLRIVAKLINPTAGAVRVNTDKLAMVFQNFALFPWLTVEENIAFGLNMSGAKESEAKKIVREQITAMGLSGVEKKHPKELSGGMKQRVGIARALAINPEILLLDEPFSALDIFTAKKLRAELLSIWKERNLTVLMVSHLVEEAVELADRVIIMSANPGKVKEAKNVGLSRPRSVRSEQFYHLVDEIEKLIHS
ncbi:MAG: ABC transporter ATP-binding protein [Candidatus Berkelbacteria bacterium]|nr:ABC transporter ATP-binding protein [Candidatus Berkelbacteria bacterium]